MHSVAITITNNSSTINLYYLIALRVVGFTAVLSDSSLAAYLSKSYHCFKAPMSVSEENKGKDEDMDVEVVSVVNEDTNSNDVEVLKVQVVDVEGEGDATPPTPLSLLNSPPLTKEQLQGMFVVEPCCKQSFGFL